MNTTTKMTTQGLKLSWDTGDIFSANFMFPTEHFKEASEIEELTDDEFCELSISLLDTVQPLTENEQNCLKKSVHVNNRLRVYYQVMLIVDSRLQIANNISSHECEDAKLSDKFDHIHMSVVTADHLVKDESDPLDVPCELLSL